MSSVLLDIMQLANVLHDNNLPFTFAGPPTTIKKI